MTSNDRIGETTITRMLDHDRVISLASGDFAPIFAAYDEHIVRWELQVDGFARECMQHGLAALALHTATRPPGETAGFTINIREPPLNLFLTGDAGTRAVTGRAFTEDVQTTTSSRLFVQTFRPSTGVHLSAMDVESSNVLRMFEEYYARSEQFPARFVHLDGTRFGLVHALPDGGRARVEGLDAAAAAALFNVPHDFLEERTLRFRCGCNPEKIIGALRQIFAGREEELFRGDPGVEAFCPRCGARWWIDRTAYDQGTAAVDE